MPPNIGTVRPSPSTVNKLGTLLESTVLKSFDWSQRHEFALTPSLVITNSTWQLLSGNIASPDITLSSQAVTGKTTSVRITDVTAIAGNFYTLANKITLADGTILNESQALFINLATLGTVNPNQDFVNKTVSSGFLEANVLKSFDWSARHEFLVTPGTTITSSQWAVFLNGAPSTDISLSVASISGLKTQVRITDVTSIIGAAYTLANLVSLSDGTGGILETQSLIIRKAQAS